MSETNEELKERLKLYKEGKIELPKIAEIYEMNDIYEFLRNRPVIPFPERVRKI